MDASRLQELGVTHVLNVAAQAPSLHADKFVYLKVAATHTISRYHYSTMCCALSISYSVDSERGLHLYTLLICIVLEAIATTTVCVYNVLLYQRLR
jgi:hypothetical protein